MGMYKNVGPTNKIYILFNYMEHLTKLAIPLNISALAPRNEGVTMAYSIITASDSLTLPWTNFVSHLFPKLSFTAFVF